MSYDLDALVGPDGAAGGGPRPLAVLVAEAREGAAELARAEVRGAANGACDGAGFVLEPTARGARLSAGASRGPLDEWLMERVALALAGPRGEVVDKHTGRRWPAALLGEWLAVAGLLSGRALAANEARINRRDGGGSTGAAVQGFAERASRVAERVAHRGGSSALATALREELSHYASRPVFAWAAARGLAAVGDFSRLEALSHAATTAGPASDDAGGDAFAVAAEYGPAALPLFARALADADPNHRRAAARALHRIASPEVLALVATALEDRRSTVREAVLESGFERLLGLEGARAALGPVLARLEHDPSSMVRRLVARARG